MKFLFRFEWYEIKYFTKADMYISICYILLTYVTFEDETEREVRMQQVRFQVVFSFLNVECRIWCVALSNVEMW